jgi:hypothetical protein
MMRPLASSAALPELASAFATSRLLPITDIDTNIENLHGGLPTRKLAAATVRHLSMLPTITKIANVPYR